MKPETMRVLALVSEAHREAAKALQGADGQESFILFQACRRLKDIRDNINDEAFRQSVRAGR